MQWWTVSPFPVTSLGPHGGSHRLHDQDSPSRYQAQQHGLWRWLSSAPLTQLRTQYLRQLVVSFQSSLLSQTVLARPLPNMSHDLIRTWNGYIFTCYKSSHSQILAPLKLIILITQTQKRKVNNEGITSLLPPALLWWWEPKTECVNSNANKGHQKSVNKSRGKEEGVEYVICPCFVLYSQAQIEK